MFVIHVQWLISLCEHLRVVDTTLYILYENISKFDSCNKHSNMYLVAYINSRNEVGALLFQLN